MRKLRREKKKKSAIREVFGWLIYLIILVTVAFLIIHFVGERTVVSGESMVPTLQDGDNLVVDKLSYRFRNPKRFEIVVFPFQYQKDTYYIKRIIGLPGETVQIYDGIVYINGKPLKESYGNQPIRNPGLASETITLGEDEYFVLGDNRNNSADSREPSVGNIHKKDIIGRALFRMWPIDNVGLLN